MAERFELTGRVEALEQRRYASGEPIEGLWSVKLRTPDGVRTCSFNSTIPTDWDNPSGERRPHPNFRVLQHAMATGDVVKITGTVARKGERTYLNGTRARVVTPAEEAKIAYPKSAGDTSSMEDAKWAVSVAASEVELDNADSLDEVRAMAAALLQIAKDLSEVRPESVASNLSAPDNVHDISEARRA
jgi:hypothetical protein